jgi:hypothetical protein
LQGLKQLHGKPPFFAREGAPQENHRLQPIFSKSRRSAAEIFDLHPFTAPPLVPDMEGEGKECAMRKDADDE